MRKFICFIMLLSILILPNPVYAANNQSIFIIGSNSATINGVTTLMEVAPFVQNNRTYMPLLYAAKAMGIDDIRWDEQKQKVTLNRGLTTAILTIGDKTMWVSGKAYTIDVAPIISNGRTCLPIAIVASAYDASVTWDGFNTVTILQTQLPQREKSLYLYAANKYHTYLGKLTTNMADPESVFNQAGKYGDKYQPYSINNYLGPFGGTVSDFSPFSTEALFPPLIEDENGKVIARLSSNFNLYPLAVNPYKLYDYALMMNGY